MLTFILLGSLLVLITGALMTYKSTTTEQRAQEHLNQLRYGHAGHGNRADGPGDN